ncbi:penicillin-binding protein 2 [Brevibacillus humidisoli]|uniref:peptidoglycan D,D-transpeptidase FtsI family protein n=1 Tax=Brevibacillus humidisoli TaxID=2895522 RepID=UPI001E5EE38F|nr:penicillin-binding protein 2 [Brevibacillus humidisoli]UFJ38973.1 penicillin-binding protein 2 [Brevibacillus humidisoli]
MRLLHKTKQRTFLLLLLFTFIWSILLFRLWWIQLGAVHHFSRHGIDLVKSAVKQRQQVITLHSGRGDILDRHGYSFTGQERLALIVFPLAQGSLQDREQIKQVATVIGRNEEEIERLFLPGKEPNMLRDAEGELISLTKEQAEQINQMQIPGIVALAVTERYRGDGLAQHAVGYVSQNPSYIKTVYEAEWQNGKMNLDRAVGAAGLEHSFDRFLQGVEPSTLSYVVDGQGHPLRGLELRYQKQENHFYPLSLVTTLDHKIQREVERVADQAGITEGSIVVLDVETGDVLAMLSRPTFDQTHVDVQAAGWQNHAVKQLPPGSVFKTVVAAAALAEGVVLPTERFECEGEYGRYGFSCWKHGGHGSITLEEAFADSCNIAFAQIANRLGAEKIEQYAQRMGLTQPVGWSTPRLFKIEHFRQIDGEQPGRVFVKNTSSRDEGALIQTAIGQRDVRITPLAAANLMVTLLHGGQPRQVRLVKEITYQNGTSFHRFASQPLSVEGIDKVTAHKLTRLLRAVVEEGTGTSLAALPWPAAGKSGTAETETAQGMRNHQWFVGYAPADQPRYAIAVVAENQPVTASHKGMKAFGLVVEALASP